MNALLARRSTTSGMIAYLGKPFKNCIVRFVVQYVAMKWGADGFPLGSLSVYPGQYRQQVTHHIANIQHIH